MPPSDTVHVLPAGHACALGRPPRGALNMALHSITLLIHRGLIQDIDAYRDVVRLIVLPPPCPLDVGPGDFTQAQRLIDRSLADGRAFLAAGGETCAPIRMSMHDHRPRPAGRRPATARSA